MRINYTVSTEEAEEIRVRMKQVKNKTACRRLETIALLGEGRSPKEVAKIKGYHEKYVRTLRIEYGRNTNSNLKHSNNPVSAGNAFDCLIGQRTNSIA